MGSFGKYYDAVNEIQSCLRRDLIGAIQKDEVLLNVEPLNTYACGILWPRRLDNPAIDHDQMTFDDIELLSEEVEPEDMVVGNDDSLSNANKRKPTSMGISITLQSCVRELNFQFEGAKYTHTEERFSEPKEQLNKETGETEIIYKEKRVHRYTRVPFKIYNTATIHKRLGTKQVYIDNSLGIEITLSVRHILNNGCTLVTVTVQNITSAPQMNIEQNVSSLFQCELTVSVDAPLVPVYQNNVLISDDEEKISALQYKDVRNFAYGHGCSVKYEETDSGVFAVSSEFVPLLLVYQMMPGEIRNKEMLSLDYWTRADRSTACAELQGFIDEYTKWRDGQAVIAKSLENEYNAAGKLILSRVNECIARLINGIKTLSSSETAWKAFQLMNESMLIQRLKTKKTARENVCWYPFQLAYILQIVPDIVNGNSDYRKAVDLLWFPTGGGKTEAYLGVSAFAIFYRRLTGNSSDDGITVIMRYTLRLLTIQQFERATALICACEHIRKRDKLPGGEISIGLWIGSSMTPNRIREAAEVLQKLRDNPSEKIYEGNPVQITKCPWCGQKIDLNGYEIIDGEMRISCADNSDCEFHNCLPIYVVDEDIYRNKPTLLLSTIDKFARIAWEENARHLFGVDCQPPELIIQDELHLISGPLGSLAGVYEIAIEYLCGLSGKQPKVIASTATVKNANEQIKNLYNRESIQFPPAGISYDNSFFAVQASGL